MRYETRYNMLPFDMIQHDMILRVSVSQYDTTMYSSMIQYCMICNKRYEGGWGGYPSCSQNDQNASPLITCHPPSPSPSSRKSAVMRRQTGQKPSKNCKRKQNVRNVEELYERTSYRLRETDPHSWKLTNRLLLIFLINDIVMVRETLWFTLNILLY